LINHGYIWRWEWYSIKNDSKSARKLLNFRISEALPETQRMIIRLTFALFADSLNYILYLNNLFSSLLLAKALKEIFIDMTGTIRKNIKGIPKWLLILKEKNKELIWNSVLSEIIKRILIFL
jgi:hypothetical protein